MSKEILLGAMHGDGQKRLLSVLHAQWESCSQVTLEVRHI